METLAVAVGALWTLNNASWVFLLFLFYRLFLHSQTFKSVLQANNNNRSNESYCCDHLSTYCVPGTMLSLEQKSCETEHFFFLMTKLKLEMWFVWRYTGSELFWIMVSWPLHLSSGCPHLPVLLISLVSSSRKEFITTSCLGNKHMGGEKVLSVPLRPWWGAQWGERVEEKIGICSLGDKGRLQKEDGIWVATKQYQDSCLYLSQGDMHVIGRAQQLLFSYHFCKVHGSFPLAVLSGLFTMSL